MRKATRMLGIVLLVGTGCADTLTTATIESPLVVEAYLFAGAPVEDIRVSEVIPLGSTDTVGAPVNDAEVILGKGGVSYRLEPVGTGGLYRYPGTGLEVAAGDRFTLQVTRGDAVVTGETVVPAVSTALALSKSTLSVPDIGSGPPSGGFTLDSIRFTWSNPTAEYFFLAIESLDENPEYILPEQIRNFIGTFRLRLRPTIETGYTLTFNQLEVIGRHRAILYRVNKEYADLYENRTQDSRDLNEPPTNLTGGLGVFSAFNGVKSEEFTVVRQ